MQHTVTPENESRAVDRAAHPAAVHAGSDAAAVHAGSDVDQTPRGDSEP